MRWLDDVWWRVQRAVAVSGPYGHRERVVRLAQIVAALAAVALAGLGLTRVVSGVRARPDAAAADPRAAAELPPLPPLSPTFAGVPLTDHLGDADVEIVDVDDLFNSAVLRDTAFARAVHGWIGYWTGPASEWFPGFLERMGRLGPTVDQALDEAGLPPSLRYLPLIESGYDPRVTSRARAVGLWQLMPSTASDLGLEVTEVVDERRHVERSTEAAVRFLGQLHDAFGSWYFVLAAYNSGPARVRGILRTHAPGQPPSDSLFWALREHFPRETREFLPKLYGAMWVASHPEAYGYTRHTAEAYEFDIVSVPDATTLHVVALAAGAPYEEVVGLNPEYVLAITPEDRPALVRIPTGRARTFRRIYPRIHPAERTTAAPPLEDGGA